MGMAISEVNWKGSKERSSDTQEFGTIIQDTMKHFMLAFMGETAISLLKFIRLYYQYNVFI